MLWIRKILLGLLIAFLVIQFIQPPHNVSAKVSSKDITKTLEVPDKILDVLKNSCYDCHSDNTRYPWYVYVQPMGWVMAKHIRIGKENLNFSQFGTYSERKQANKLRAIATSTGDGSMPLSSYIIMHTDAKLSMETVNLIAKWALIKNDSISLKN